MEIELRDEILPRAQNIQSRLDRQTIETEEVCALRRGLGTEDVEPGGRGLPSPSLLTWTSCPSVVPHCFLPWCRLLLR